MLVSACLIVKNEAKNLPRCLNSIREKVNEIVVVDTGSTDDTVLAALSFTRDVFPFPWCDDFAAARNFALDHCTGNYVFWLDADDELIESTLGSFRREIEASDLGLWVDVRCPGTDGRTGIVRHWRVFPLDGTVQFYGAIHEQPMYDGTTAYAVARLKQATGFYVLHHGYEDMTPEAAQAKRERNLAIIAAELDKPLTPARRASTLLSRAFLESAFGDKEGAYQTMYTAMSLWWDAGRPEWWTAARGFGLTAELARMTGRSGVAVAMLAPAREAGAVSPELLCVVGDAYLDLGQLDQAAECFQQAAFDKTIVQPWAREEQFAGSYPIRRLAGIAQQQGLIVDAANAMALAEAMAL